jgi:hypothetical protein
MNDNLYSPAEEASVIFRAHEPLWTLRRKKKDIFLAGDWSPVVWSAYEFGSVPGPLLRRRSGVWTDMSSLLMVRPVTGSCRPAGPLCPVANGDLAATLTDNRNAVRIQQSAAVHGNTSDSLAWYMGDQTQRSYFKCRPLHSAISTQAHNEWDHCSTSPSISNMNQNHIPLRTKKFTRH